MRCRTRLNLQRLLIFAAFAAATASVAFAAEGSFDRTLRVSGPVDLQIETGSGSIEVRPGGSSEVRVTRSHSNEQLGAFRIRSRARRHQKA